MFARWWPLLFWLAVGAMSAGALVMEWRNPPRLPVPTVVEAPAAVTVPPLQSFDPPDLLRYAQIAERPNFIDTRRRRKTNTVAFLAGCCAAA
ncbi:MAG: hypothetical protein H6975_09325 [Gammaproteobacteria bacterium]|nr:hypothetical protein [Gammaproteobacteria bacterium]